MTKDNSFTFTRYLYEKDEVEIHLLLSLFSLKRKEALFWAFELFYSGLECELINYLLKIYYYFYASLNPGLESFLIKKTKELDKNDMNLSNQIIASIIENLLIRPFHMDTFFLYQLNNSLKNDYSETFSCFKLVEIWPKIFDYPNELKTNKVNIELLLFLLFKSSFQDSLFLLKDLIDFFELDINKEKFLLNYKKTSIYLKFKLDEKIMLISKIMYLYGLKIKKKMGKNLYICIDLEELIIYETISIDIKNNLPAYKILSEANSLNIEPSICSNLFILKREKENIKDAYLNNWLFYASKCPLWNKRILDFKGKVDEIKKQVIFEDEDQLLEFYENYGYEPDEQKENIQKKCLGKDSCLNNNTNWILLYEEFGFQKRFIDISNHYLKNLNKLNKNDF